MPKKQYCHNIIINLPCLKKKDLMKYFDGSKINCKRRAFYLLKVLNFRKK